MRSWSENHLCGVGSQRDDPRSAGQAELAQERSVGLLGDGFALRAGAGAAGQGDAVMSYSTVRDTIHHSLRVFCPCPDCNGEGMRDVVITDRGERQEDFELCGECHGTGTTADLDAPMESEASEHPGPDRPPPAPEPEARR